MVIDSFLLLEQIEKKAAECGREVYSIEMNGNNINKLGAHTIGHYKVVSDNNLHSGAYRIRWKQKGGILSRASKVMGLVYVMRRE